MALVAARFKEAAKPFDPQASVFDLIGYSPTPKQWLFHNATEYDVLYGGAASGGKTAALVADDIKDCIRYPGIRIGAYRRTFDELDESFIKQLGQFGFAERLGARWNATAKELRFPNGSLIRYRFAENIIDASKRMGGEYQKISFDERTLFAPGVVDRLIERIRTANPNIPVIGIRSGTNPGGPDGAAVKERYVIGTDYGDQVYTDDNEQTVRFIQALVWDNPHINKAYVKTLQAIPDPARRAAMLEGDWDQYDGMVFVQWRRERHVVPAFDVPASWNRYAGIDWGYRNPWAVVWAAVDEDGRAWVYRELYQTEVGEDVQAQTIVELDQGEHVIARFADDAMWTGRGAAKSVAQVYADNHCSITPAHKGERVTGWQRVHSYLSDAPACTYHREQGWERCPNLHVLEGAAPNLIRTLPALAYDQRKPEDVDTKSEDHAPDALRYLLINLAEPTITGWLHDDAPLTADHAVYDPTAQAPDWWLNEDEEAPWASGHVSWDPNSL